jgi:hypothetical protein
MSTLVMALAAGLTLGSSPEPVSMEFEQRLDMRGEWEGTEKGTCIVGKPYSGEILLVGQMMTLTCRVGDGLAITKKSCKFVDEGPGTLRTPWGLGIYRQNGDRLLICFSKDGRPRPTSFRAGNGQVLLTLRRVK